MTFSCNIIFAVGYINQTVNAWLAQLVEQRTENPRVSGSIPEPGSVRVWFNGRTSAFQAGYVGPIPITRFAQDQVSCVNNFLNGCDSGVVGNARPCQGRDRGFESRLSLLKSL